MVNNCINYQNSICIDILMGYDLGPSVIISEGPQLNCNAKIVNKLPRVDT